MNELIDAKVEQSETIELKGRCLVEMKLQGLLIGRNIYDV
jgi:hypothetical protein